MRKYLLAGAALAVATAALPVVAKADDMGPKVYIGGVVFESFWDQNATNQNKAGWGSAASAATTFQDYTIYNYMRLLPTVDYAAPDGMHYGFVGQVRGGASGASGFYWDRAYVYAKSERMGTIEVGAWVGAIEENAVANDMASGTGGWDGEYGFFGAQGGVQWLNADTAADNTMGVHYNTPSFGGLKLNLSLIPDSTQHVTQDVSINMAPAIAMPAAAGNASPGLATSGVKNRFEAIATYNGTFGASGVAADLGYAGGTAESPNAQNLSVITGGVKVSFAGLSVGGEFNSGKYGGGYTALPTGASNTTSYDAGVVYSFGAAEVGAQYYGYKISSAGATTAFGTEKFSGAALGAAYKLNPGVKFMLDALVGSKQDTGFAKTNYTGVGLGTYFQW